jgi:hypothetical protein
MKCISTIAMFREQLPLSPDLHLETSSILDQSWKLTNVSSELRDWTYRWIPSTEVTETLHTRLLYTSKRIKT